MITYSFYREDTGELIEGHVSCTWSQLAANTPPGCRSIEGRFDHRTQRVNIATQTVTDLQSVVTARPKRVWHSDIRRQIDALERKQQRRIRELLASSDPQLKAIDDEISRLRGGLQNG